MNAIAPNRLRVIGVRHHSPACARLVKSVLEAVRPQHVLIEGPADFNARIGELALGHQLPIAIFTHYQDQARRHASWTPLCAYSPEWVALETARAIGAEARFCDLPAWHPAFAGRRNRYGDLEGARERARSDRALAALCARTHTDDLDSLWDHLFEQPSDDGELERRLELYFRELRGDAPGGERDEPREALMSRWAAWALHDAARRGDRGVVVVCGGWHAPVIARDALVIAAAGPIDPPEIEPVERGARHGSDLVPYSYRRLDSFAGYDAGMPSPAYHEWVWEHGHEHAADLAVKSVTTRVRARKQPLSTADLIAGRSLSSALAALRGHRVTMRTDVLDGLAGALVKDGLEVAFPWARRGTLSPRTDPILVELVAALSGDRRGVLAAGTPRPPLHADVARELSHHGIEPGPKAQALSLSLREPAGRARSRVLHRLRVLGIPGFHRDRGPDWATDTLLDESWTIAAPLDQEPALIEASQWGATLEGAALARLEASLLEANGRLSALSRILGEAVFVGIAGLEDRVIEAVTRAVAGEPSLGDLGAATTRLLDLTLHGDLFDASHASQLEAVLIAAFDRGLWLLEGIVGPSSPLDEAQVMAVVALRDLLHRGPPEVIAARDRADGVLSRRALDPQSPPSIRGACLGAQWSLERLGDPAASAAHAVQAVKSASLPTTLGDFLAGLFATARSQVLESPELVAAIDRVLTGLADHETMVALPSLRLAFSYFPPRERERIAERVLAIHGADTDQARAMVGRLEVRPEDVAAGVAIDHAVSTLVARHGLRDPLDPEVA